jgi:DNA invertase Pin-like site-specific DNA recombinase
MARTKRKVNPILPAAVQTEQPRRVYQVGGYARLSVEDSGKPGADTISTQRELIQSYIDGQPDMRLYDLYCDNGRTGTNFDRPEFERMMEDVRSGKVDCIVVKDLSRFGRNYRETGNYLERIFPLLDVRFIAVNDNFDTLTAERTQDGYIVPLKNIMNAVYSKDISRKILPALATKQQNGEFIGSWAAYGYQKCADDHHRIEPDEETAPVVWDIFQWRLSGLSYQNIARKLNERGIPSPARYHYLKGDAKSERYANTVWSITAVKKICTDEVYLGHMVQGRKRSGFSEGRKHYKVPESEWVIVRNTHEPLVDEETFRTVQRMAAEASSAYKERLGRHDSLGKIPNILRGLIYCADCKRPLVRYKSVTNKGKNLYYVYICPTHSNDLTSCPKKYFHETKLIEILWDTLRREIALAENLDKLVRQYSKSAKAISWEAETKREIAAAKQAFRRAEMLYDSLYQNYADKLMTEQEYTEMKRQYRSDMERAQTRLEELEQRQRDERQQTTENPWLTACGQFKEETALTGAMAHALIERVEIDGADHVSIALRYRDKYNALLRLLAAEGEAVPA